MNAPTALRAAVTERAIVDVRDRPAIEPSGALLRVLVVAAYPAVRAGLVALLAREPDLGPLEERAGARTLGTTARPAAPGPDLGLAAIVVDLAGTPPAAADDFADAYLGIPLVLLGADPAADGPGLGAEPVAYLGPEVDGPSLAAAVRAVAAGLTVLDPAAIAAAGIHAHGLPGRARPDVAAGEPLTARERQVLELVAAGLPNKAIARELGISEHTAKFHVGSLLTKLGAASRTEAVTLATRRGLLAVGQSLAVAVGP